MDVSIIIVNYHSHELIEDCVESILEKTKEINYEIIVVDNDSNEESVKKLSEKMGGFIKIIPSPENLGFGKANNLGIRHATGEYVFMLNPDTILINNAIKILHDYLRMHKNVGVVGGNLFDPNMNPTPSYALQFDHWKEEKKKASWRMILKSKISDKVVKKKKQLNFKESFNYENNPIEVAYIFGADMMMEKALFEEVGGFDPDFFMYGEEEELTWRIHNKGLKIMSVPDAKIIHLEGGTIQDDMQFSERHFRMRMNGTMTYYYKVYGLEGLEKYFKYRSRRYKILIIIAKMRGKDLSNNEAKSCAAFLEDEYLKLKKRMKIE